MILPLDVLNNGRIKQATPEFTSGSTFVAPFQLMSKLERSTLSTVMWLEITSKSCRAEMIVTNFWASIGLKCTHLNQKIAIAKRDNSATVTTDQTKAFANHAQTSPTKTAARPMDFQSHWEWKTAEPNASKTTMQPRPSITTVL